MKKGYLAVLVLVILTFVLISGCGKKTVCNKPYILVGKNCCLDQNSNNICDNDEGAAPVAAPTTPEPAATPTTTTPTGAYPATIVTAEQKECYDDWKNNPDLKAGESNEADTKAFYEKWCGQCMNGVKDGDETGVDCGGALCDSCTA